METERNMEKIKNREFLLYAFLMLICFLGDIIRRIAYHLNWEFTRYSTASKIIFILVSSIYLIYQFSKYRIPKIKKVIIQKIFFLIIIFLIGHFVFDNSENSLKTTIVNIEFLGKYLFFPYLLLLFMDLFSDKTSILKLINIFEILFFINIVVMITGSIFEIQVFKTYFYGNRFGYKGIYSMSSQTTIYFILMMFYYTYRLLEKYDKWVLFKLFFVISTSLLIGTKTVYFFLVLLCFYYLIFLKGYKRIETLKIGIPLLTTFIAFVLIFKNQILKTANLFYEIYVQKGFFSSFTSYRSDLLITIYEDTISKQWTLGNIIFGGLDFSEMRSEMGFIDLYLFFGILGFFIYLSFYKFILRFDFKKSFFCFFLLSSILIVFFTDKMIFEPNIPILLFLICSYFFKNDYTVNGKPKVF